MIFKTLMMLSLIYTLNGYSITKEGVEDCISKYCTNEVDACNLDSVCKKAISDFNSCYEFYKEKIYQPYEECKGVANEVYSTMMECYEKCDYELIFAINP